MKRRSIMAVTGALMAMVVFTGSAFADTLFSNGSFETGPYVQDSTGYGYMTIAAGTNEETAIDGWKVTAGEIDWIGTYWPAVDGSKSIDLNGLKAGAISQTFPTTANNTYVVTFKLAANPDNWSNEFGAPALKTLSVEATGNAAKPLTVDATGTSHDVMPWHDAGYSFVAKGSSTTITFTSTTDSVSGPVLDKIAITETVATGAGCKNGGWQAMVDKYGTSFRNQGDCVSYYATGEKNLAN